MTAEQCTICGAGTREFRQRGAATTREWAGRTARIHRCLECEHVWFGPLPTHAELDAYYQSNDFYESSPWTPEQFQAAWSPIPLQAQADYLEATLRHLRACGGPSGPRVFDFACGFGGFMLALRDHGVASTGCDMDETCVASCRALGLDVVQGGVDALSGQVDLDWISCYHSIEHFRDPLSFLGAAARSLTPGGHLSLAFPNGGYLPAQVDFFGAWDWVFYPEHLHFFSPTSITRALLSVGLEVVDLWSDDSSDTQREWMGRCVSPMSRTWPVRRRAFDDGRDLRVIAQRPPISSSRQRRIHSRRRRTLRTRPWRVTGTAPAYVGPVTFQIVDLDASCPTPILHLTTETSEPLPAGLKIIMHLVPAGAASDDFENRDFWPALSSEDWGIGATIAHKEALVGLGPGQFEILVGIWGEVAYGAPVPIGRIATTS